MEHSFAKHLSERFGLPGAALAIVGSHAAGEAGPFSDVDLVRFLPNESTPADDGSKLISGQLVVVSSLTPSAIEACFERPERAVETIAGLRGVDIVSDPLGRLATIRERAEEFVWDEMMQNRADVWVADQLVGWAEEAHKGLEGLRRGDTGRLLHARFGLSWGLARVLIVRHGILLVSDNSFLEQLKERLADSPQLCELLDRAFGLVVDDFASPLRSQVQAGLHLYLLTSNMVESALVGHQRELVEHTSGIVRQALGESESR